MKSGIVKKGIHAASFLLMLIINNFFSNPAAQPITTGLVAYYPLNGNGQDVSGNTLNGTVLGATPTSDRFNEANSALDFDGTSAYVLVGGLASELRLAGTPYTISFWLKWNGANSQQYQNILSMEDGADFSGGYELYLISSGRLNFTHNNGLDQTWYSTNSVDEVWRHYSLTWDGSQRALYINGALVETRQTTGNLQQDGDDPFVLGALRTQGGAYVNFFNGSLDDVRIYNKALSSSEVTQQYQSDILPKIQISSEPTSVTINQGQTATFSVGVSGTGSESATYQWFENGSVIPGATSNSYTTPVQQSPGQKNFSVTIHSGSTVLTSQSATLTVLAPGQDPWLLAHWTFDENFESVVADQTGRFPGQVRNATRISGRVGDGAIHLNGNDAHVLIGGQNTALQLLNTPYTFSWWQRWEGPTATHQNIFAMDDGADYSGGYQVSVFRGATDFINVHADGTTQGWFSFAHAEYNWHFYALTFDGKVQRFYVNGVLAASREVSGPLKSDGDDPFVLGALRVQNGTFVNFFPGALDDFRIYTRTLSPEEISTLGPTPAITITRQPIGYRIGDGQSITLSVAASVTGTSAPLSYQWELNGAPVPEATEPNLLVTGDTGAIKKYRVLIKAGNLQVYSDEVEVVTVTPGDARLLLHLGFDEAGNTVFSSPNGFEATVQGSLESVPGRVGDFALNFSGSGHLHIPAAGTDLELVGASYTIAWWMKTPQNYLGGQVFTLGESAGFTGYAARLEGNPNTRVLRSFHRNGQVQQVTTLVRNITNWHHFAIVYNGIARTIYVNGSPTNILATSLGLLGTGRDDLIIGADFSGAASSVGAIDDFRIYNYALATDEIANLSNVSFPTPRMAVQRSGNNLIITWPMSDSTHRVEYLNAIASDVTWAPLSAPISTSGSYYQITQPIDREVRYYRLRKL